MKMMRNRLAKPWKAIIATGLVTVSLISASIVTSYIMPTHEVYALDDPNGDLQYHQRQQAQLRSELAGVNSQLAHLIEDLNDLVNNQIPAAENAASQAQDQANAASQRAKEANERLLAAQKDKQTLEKQISTAQADYSSAQEKVAALARRSFHGTSASKTMSVVTGSKTTEDFIQAMQSDAAVSRVEAKAASDSASELSTGKNRADRLQAIEQRIAGLKAQADSDAQVAAQASTDAHNKVESLNELRSKADQKSQELKAQQSNLQTRAAQEAAAIVQAQAQIEEYNRKLAAQYAAAAAAARRQSSNTQYTGGRANENRTPPQQSQPAVAYNPGGYTVPGNCGPTATFCYGHSTGRTAVLGGAYPWSQCTWYAYNRRTELGLPVGSYMGNGGDWANTARRLGYAVDNVPHVGDAVVFRPGQAGADWTYGHVAIVERVNANGTILISECSAEYRGRIHTRIVGNVGAYQYVHY